MVITQHDTHLQVDHIDALSGATIHSALLGNASFPVLAHCHGNLFAMTYRRGNRFELLLGNHVADFSFDGAPSHPPAPLVRSMVLPWKPVSLTYSGSHANVVPSRWLVGTEAGSVALVAGDNANLIGELQSCNPPACWPLSHCVRRSCANAAASAGVSAALASHCTASSHPAVACYAVRIDLLRRCHGNWHRRVSRKVGRRL